MVVARSRQLRRNSTEAEKLLWSRLRNRALNGAKFRRQAPIGPFVVDFVCLDSRVVVEVDGGHHSATQAKDARRAAWLESEGYRVFRFWNHEVLGNVEGVLQTIATHLGHA
ncbi:MAG: endonuclease domain-containing protein [Alphaproteobacteria bacterium]